EHVEGTGRVEGTGYEAQWRTESTNVLDRYLNAKTRQLVLDVTDQLEALDSPMAAAKLRDFGDVLTNWYVRRSRDRFWAGTDTESFDTLYTVLETLTRVAAPLIPLVGDEIWRGLTAGRSVHLTDWPDATVFPADDELVTTMDRVRAIASAGLSLRKSMSLRVRLPLAKLTVVSDDGASLAQFADILLQELNVKSVDFSPLEADSFERFGITQKLTVNSRAAGPRIGKQVQTVIKAARAGDWEATGDTVVVGGVELLPGEFELALQSADDQNAIAFLADGGFVILDTETTPELESEGLARDMIRVVQDTRKAAGLNVSDRIALSIRGEASADLEALTMFQSTIQADTLATELRFGHDADPAVGAALGSAAGSQRTTLIPGQYANTGALVIDVWKAASVDV
ncbi:MAG: isoleucine-tRNA ligase, partial [Microbacteriaceae bacterium]|nr:isoleucine-tRNA ligase [Microbacteriaceae bacterium]